jgi:hypothetical protein
VPNRDAEHAPSVPTLDRPSLILHSSYHGPLDVRAIDRRAVGGIAKLLAHAGPDRATIARARAAGLAVALPGEAWRNQLPPDHQKRGLTFQRLAYALPGRLDIEAVFGPGFLRGYAAAYLDEQIERGATILQTPGHVLPREGGQARENDVALARATVEEYAGRRARLAAEDGRPRPLLATIVVRGEHLTDRGVASVVAAYSGLDGVHGFWVVVANYGESKWQAMGLAALSDALERRTGLPVVLSGVSGHHLAFLASGVVSATCMGHHGATLRFPPTDWPRSTDTEEEQGIGVQVHHRAILGAVQLGEKYDDARGILFGQWPCSCGLHAARVPPRTHGEILGHNAWTLMANVASLCVREPEERAEYLEMRLDKAATIRSELGLGRLRAGWRGPGDFTPPDEQSSGDEGASEPDGLPG